MTHDTQELVTRLRREIANLDGLTRLNEFEGLEYRLYMRSAAALTAQAEETRALKEALITIRDKRGQCNRAADCQAVARAALAGKWEP